MHIVPTSASRPSETSAGRAWLSHFERDEVGTASLLIDSLEIHEHTHALNALREELLRVLGEVGSQPAVLIAIRSLEDLPEIDESTNHIAYRTFQPGSVFPSLPGSEADIGALSRDLVNSYPDIFLSPELDLAELKRREVRTIYLVSDYSGSGKQALRFAETFLSNPTIASWISYKLVRIRILTHAASLTAASIFETNKHIDFRSLQTAKSADGANWSQEQRRAIEHLCTKYADPSQDNALGYKGSFGLHLSNFRVPNNLPQILIRGAGSSWPGLFANRSLPVGFYNELPSYHASDSLTQTLRNLGASDIADRIETSHRPVPGLRALAALHLLDYNLSEAHVFGLLEMSEENLHKLKASLLSLELITIDNRVTRLGRHELSLARRRARPRADRERSGGLVDYVPTQLR